MAFTSCKRVVVSNLQVLAPAFSPNTDGIHISATKGIEVKDSLIRTGDDCISIVRNSLRIRIRDISCGPGHGISIGSLGKSKAWEKVQDVHVKGAYLYNTDNGVRIKTWQGDGGFSSKIKFQNILMENVSNPIIIDQYYCDSRHPCKNQPRGKCNKTRGFSPFNHNGSKFGIVSLRNESSSPRRHSIGTPRNSMRLQGAKSFGVNDKVASDMDNCSEYNDKNSEAGSHQSMDDFRNKSSSLRLKLAREDINQNLNEDMELLKFGDADSEERLSDISDDGLSIGTETDGSISSIVEYTLFPELEKAVETTPAKERTTNNLLAEST
ncbi:Regulator of chromosome condensation, RCC1 [Sesbania bispinosa]|nr:Regulator of chromosome condensation, RCC1 [Sesbania bispinosa]